MEIIRNMGDASLSRDNEGTTKCLNLSGFGSRLCKPADQTCGVAVHSNAMRDPVLAFEPRKLPEAVQDFGVRPKERMRPRVCFLAPYKPMSKGDSRHAFHFKRMGIGDSACLEEDSVDSVALLQLCFDHIRRENPLPFDPDRVPRGDLQLSDPTHHQPSAFNSNPHHCTDPPGTLWCDDFHTPLQLLQCDLLPALEQDLALPGKAPAGPVVPPRHVDGWGVLFGFRCSTGGSGERMDFP